MLLFGGMILKDVTTEARLVAIIELESVKAGYMPATLCGKHAGNKRLYKNLKEGKSCTLKVANRLLANLGYPKIEVGTTSRTLIDDVADEVSS